MADPTQVTRGQIVYDKEQLGEEPSPMVIVDPNPGLLGDLDEDTKEAVRRAETNEDYDTSDEAYIVSTRFVSEDGVSHSTYAYPVERIHIPRSREVYYDYPPSVYYRAEMLVDLMEEYEGIDDVTAMDAEVSGMVILCADRIIEERDE